MKILKKAKLNVFVLLTAVCMLIVSLFTGGYIPCASAETAFDESKIEYVDTDVEAIIYAQHSSYLFFGFRLTESDYDDYGLYEGDFGGKPAYATYEQYIAVWLNYWNQFSKNNSKGVVFDQLYAYWNGSSVGEAKFANTVAHRSTLKLLEYGFVISIPEGTTFPSLEYVIGNCESETIKMYRTTEDKAFYFNGTSFEPLSYAIAQERSAAIKELDAVKTTGYYQAEKAMVKALVAEAKAEVELSFTSFAVQDVLDNFYKKLAEIMTILDYQALAKSKEEAKETLATFFDGLNEANYEVEEWATILAMKDEYADVIDGVSSLVEVDGAVRGVKFAVENVMTKAEKAGLADYIAAAIARLEASFNPSIYRAEEQAQGETFVAQGKEAIAAADSYSDVDGISASYIARIDALKTDAEWVAEEEAKRNEEQNNQEDYTPPSGEDVEGKDDAKTGMFGCAGFMSTAGSLAMIAAGVAMVIKKKKEGIEK